jgi:MFS family permease
MQSSISQNGTQESFIRTVRELPGKFWLLNIVQMLEKLAYWSVLLQMSVYIAQKDVAGGLAWAQTLKGIIFFVWAMVQNLTPFFLGGLADKIGRKKLIVISLSLIIVSYLILATKTDFPVFFAGVLLLGFASGLFKPALQGALAASLRKENSATGWGIYFMLLNLAVIAAPPLSKYLKELSWAAVFYGSGVIMLLNLLIAAFWKSQRAIPSSQNIFAPVKTAMKSFIRPKVYVFILAMSGFAIVYMQFYETFQNFIMDWSDTSQLAAILPAWMTMETARGIMISYEWLYTINSVLITLFVVFVSRTTGAIPKIKAIILGILLSTVGIAMAGGSMSGTLLIIGFVVYTFGEMIVNPKFTDYLGTMASKQEKSMYLGYLNLSMAIGLGGGALLGGYLYEHFGEKSSLAIKYLTENNIVSGVSHQEAFTLLIETLKTTPAEATTLLWNLYHPWIMWLPFIAIALLSVFVLFLYSKKFKT